jgi:hypothetical protein
MKRFLRFNKKVTALLTVASLLLLTVVAYATSFVASDGTVAFCIWQGDTFDTHTVRVIRQDIGETCGQGEELTVINQRGPSGPAGPAGPAGATGATGPAGASGTIHIRNFEKRSGPPIVDTTASFHTLITMTNLPNGFYKLESNGILDYPQEDLGMTYIPSQEDYKCQLVVVPDGTGQGNVVDAWETEASGALDVSFFLKAAINLQSSNNSGSVRVDCAIPGDLTIINSEWLKIIAVEGSDLIQQPGH